MKVGHIDFLNVLPLSFGYAHVERNFDIVRGVPTFLNGELKAGRLDISNVSSIEYARQSRDLLILPKICVRADCDVTSIVLVSRRKIDDIGGDKVVLTEKSATAQRLLKIILHEHGAEPIYDTRAVKVDKPVDDDATAALLIGDDALSIYLHPPENFFVYDLGVEWHKLTGKQMVYALWVVRKIFAEENPELLRTAYQTIRDAFAYGVAYKAEAIQSVLQAKPFTFAELDRYLGNVIKWDLTADGLDALKTYYRRAAELNLIDAEPELHFAV